MLWILAIDSLNHFLLLILSHQSDCLQCTEFCCNCIVTNIGQMFCQYSFQKVLKDKLYPLVILKGIFCKGVGVRVPLLQNPLKMLVDVLEVNMLNVQIMSTADKTQTHRTFYLSGKRQNEYKSEKGKRRKQRRNTKRK